MKTNVNPVALVDSAVVAIQRQPSTPSKRERALDLHARGALPKAIASEVGARVSDVRGWLAEADRLILNRMQWLRARDMTVAHIADLFGEKPAVVRLLTDDVTTGPRAEEC